MIHRCIREWSYLGISSDAATHAISRASADSLIAVARSSTIGGAEGEAILVNGHTKLRAQQIVGVLAGRGVTLEILPKIDGSDDGQTRRILVRLLARVIDLKIDGGTVTDIECQRHNLLEIVVRLMCSRIFQAVHRGLPRSYREFDEDLPRVRGRLNVVRQFTTLAVSPQKLACRFDELTPDIPLNQIMKAAIEKMSNANLSFATHRQLAELASAFEEVRRLPVAMLPWDKVVLDRTNRHWQTLLKMATLILEQKFQTTTSGENIGFSLLFEMNVLFEEYIGRSLQRVLRHVDVEVRRQGPRSFALIAENEKGRFATIPDIAISKNGHAALIIDTKWKRLSRYDENSKRDIGQADVYQMMAYAQIYKCPRLMLLYPHHDGLNSAEGVLEVFQVAGSLDCKLVIACVSLSDLETLDSRLLKLVRSQLSDELFDNEIS